MAMTNVELYEALKDSIPERAARMIAEAFHPASELATRSDLVEVRAALKQEIAEVRTEMREGFAELRAQIQSLARMQQRMWGFFVPMWVGTFGTLIAVVLKS